MVPRKRLTSPASSLPVTSRTVDTSVFWGEAVSVPRKPRATPLWHLEVQPPGPDLPHTPTSTCAAATSYSEAGGTHKALWRDTCPWGSGLWEAQDNRVRTGQQQMTVWGRLLASVHRPQSTGSLGRQPSWVVQGHLLLQEDVTRLLGPPLLLGPPSHPAGTQAPPEACPPGRTTVFPPCTAAPPGSVGDLKRKPLLKGL